MILKAEANSGILSLFFVSKVKSGKLKNIL